MRISELQQTLGRNETIPDPLEIEVAEGEMSVLLKALPDHKVNSLKLTLTGDPNKQKDSMKELVEFLKNDTRLTSITLIGPHAQDFSGQFNAQKYCNEITITEILTKNKTLTELTISTYWLEQTQLKKLLATIMQNDSNLENLQIKSYWITGINYDT